MGTTGLSGSPNSTVLTDQALRIHCLARNIQHVCIRIYIERESRAEIKLFETFVYIVRVNSPCG